MDQFLSTAELSSDLAAALDRGAVVLTGNQRAARSLRLAYDRLQRDRGIRVWRQPTVLAWETWVARCWHEQIVEGRTGLVLLSRAQELQVWQAILTAARKDLPAMQSSDALAELAAEAWRLCAQFRATVQVRQSAASFETRSYLRWAAEFENRCRERSWLAAANLETSLEESVERGYLTIAEIVLVGFDELTPARKSLLERFRDAGTLVTSPASSRQNGATSSIALNTTQEELYATARWALAQLQKDSSLRIAVIVPSLEAQRPAINRVFQQVLAPGLSGLDGVEHPVPYEFSIGVPLSDTPLVQVALQLLQWAAGPIPLEAVSSLLVSSLFASDGNDLDRRAIFDAFELRKPRRLLQPAVTLGWLLGISSGNRGLPQKLVSALTDLQQTALALDVDGRQASFSDWADAFRKLLLSAQWNTHATESSHAFQLRQRWEAALDETASLDLISEAVSYKAALTALQRIARSTTFAPESQEAPIQVLGPLESAGSHFDAIWFIGAGDLTWPARRTFNPLLPWSVQANVGMPGEIAVDEIRDRRVLGRIAESAAQVIFSFAQETRNNRQRLSPLIKEIVTAHSLSSIEMAEPSKAQGLELETFYDMRPPKPLQDHSVRGGSQILHLQAMCPFRAFAEKRLLSTELTTVGLGMDSMQRGTAVHLALEIFWHEVETQSNLHSMSTERLEHLIRKAVHVSIPQPGEQGSPWEKAYIEVQRERLKRLLRQWIEVELGREPFALKQTEKKYENVQVGPLQFDVRVDRVDSTDAGDVVIDYKTGAVRSADWFGDRPDAPQLPLYAVVHSERASETPIADIAFAKVHAGEGACFEAYTGTAYADSSWSPRRNREPIEHQIAKWKMVLTRLAESFANGEAEVDPKSYPTTCKNCAQRLLCRLDPSKLRTEDDHEPA